MPDEEPSPGVFGLLRDVISIAGAFDRKYCVFAQRFRNGGILRIVQK